MKCRVVIPFACVLILAGGALADRIDRRGAAPPLEGEINRLDDSGASIRTAAGAVQFVPWDRVRGIQADISDPRLSRFLAVADDLWRARSRLERGDAALAEPLFERLFERYRGQTHETALVVAEGLLRCRLARTDHTAAVIPALEAIRIHRTGVRTDSYTMLPALFDETSGLCVELPPVWVPSRFLSKLELDLAAFRSPDDAEVAHMASRYRAAARRLLGLPPHDVPPDVGTDSVGLALIDGVVQSLSPDPVQRRRARERLVALSAVDADPIGAWSQFAIGLTRLGEPSPDQQQRGLLDLLQLPARHRDEQPYLSGIALVLAAQWLQADGRDAAATSLLDELDQRYPGHPARDAVQDGVRFLPLFGLDEDNE